jgi:replicative DNA helicase
MEMADEGQLFDIITVTQRLRDQKTLDSVGGAPFITHLFTSAPTVHNLGNYIDIVEEKFTLREIIRTCSESVNRAYDEQDDVPALLNTVETDVLAIARHMERGSDQIDAKAAASEAMLNIRWRVKNPGKIRGLSTGFHRLDMRSDGLHAQELIILASRPSCGKTALAIQMAEHIAFDLRKPVAFFSLEMSRQQFLERWIYMRAKANPSEIRQFGADEATVAALEKAAEELAAAPICIEDSEGLTIQQFRASARRIVREKKVAAIFLDSGSAMKSTSRQAQMKHEREVADITAGLKSSAKELNVPIIALWHIGRQHDSRENEDPKLSDLRGGATVEQDADVVAMILPKWNEGASHPVEIFLPKQRCAERYARAQLIFHPGFTRFTEPHEEPEEQELPLAGETKPQKNRRAK